MFETSQIGSTKVNIMPISAHQFYIDGLFYTSNPEKPSNSRPRPWTWLWSDLPTVPVGVCSACGRDAGPDMLKDIVRYMQAEG